MNRRQLEMEQIYLDEERETLEKLKSNYEDALDEIDQRIFMLQGRSDANLQYVIYQVDYQKALRSQVEAILDELHSNNFDTVAEYLSKSYEQGYVGTMYDLQGQGIPLVMPIDQKQVVAAIKHETKLSKGLYEALGKDTKVLSKQISAEISRGISTQSEYAVMARNIANRAGISQNNAMRIARTEAHRIQNRAITDCQAKAKKRGADIVKIWSSALDGRTRDTHRKLDGQIRELDEPFEVDGMEVMEPGGFGIASEDCNCRCRCLSKARWLLDAQETKHLGNTGAMSDEQLEPIADKLGLEVDELRQYSDQIIPVKAKSYEDFRQQYERIVNYEEVGLRNKANGGAAGYQNSRDSVKTGLSSKYGSTVEDHDPPKVLGKLEDRRKITETLIEYEKKIANEPIENAIVITKDGLIIQCFGGKNDVWPNVDLEEKLIGSSMTHNHPIGSDNEYSFSKFDLSLFMDYKLDVLRGIDERYIYQFTRNQEDIDNPIAIFDMTEYDLRHTQNIEMAKALGIGYRRWLRE